MLKSWYWLTTGALLCAGAFIIGCNSADGRRSADSKSEWLRDNFDKIEEEDEETAERHQILPFTYFAAGQLFEKQNQLAKAMLQYRKAISGNPEFVSAYNRLGICLNKTGHYQEADACFREAIRLAPEQASLYNNLAFSLMLQKRWAEAEQELRRAADINPDYQRVRMNLAIAMMHQGRPDEAYVEFQSILGVALAHYNMGLLYKSQGLYRQARDSFRSALEVSPKMAQARRHLNEVLAQLGGDEQQDPGMAQQMPVREVPAVAVAAQPMPAAEPARPRAAVVQPAPRVEPEPAVKAAAPVASHAANQPNRGRPVMQVIPPPEVQEQDWQVVRQFAVPANELPQGVAGPDPRATRRRSSGPSTPVIRPRAEVSRPTRVNLQALRAEAVDVDLGELAGEVQAFPDNPADQGGFEGGTPVVLQNEPCEPELLKRQLAVITNQLRPCREGDYVDQFVFGPSGYEQENPFVTGATRTAADERMVRVLNRSVSEVLDNTLEGHGYQLRPGAADPAPEDLLELQNNLQNSWDVYWNRLREPAMNPVEGGRSSAVDPRVEKPGQRSFSAPHADSRTEARRDDAGDR